MKKLIEGDVLEYKNDSRDGFFKAMRDVFVVSGSVFALLSDSPAQEKMDSIKTNQDTLKRRNDSINRINNDFNFDVDVEITKAQDDLMDGVLTFEEFKEIIYELYDEKVKAIEASAKMNKGNERNKQAVQSFIKIVKKNRDTLLEKYRKKQNTSKKNKD